MALYVFSLGEGPGDVTYKWEDVEPCEENFGCTPCDQWACKPPDVAYCNGHHGACTSADTLEAALAIQSVQQEICDDNQTNCASSVSAAVPECFEWPTPLNEDVDTPSPTPGPTPSPITPQPCPDQDCSGHGIMEDEDHRDGCNCTCD